MSGISLRSTIINHPSSFYIRPMRPWLYVCGIVLLSAAAAHGQTQAQMDSLNTVLRATKDVATRAQLMIKLSSGYIDISPDSSVAFAERALALTAGGDLKKERALAFRHKATAIGRLGNDAGSMALYRQALAELKGGVSPFTEAGIHRNLGNGFSSTDKDEA